MEPNNQPVAQEIPQPPQKNRHTREKVIIACIITMLIVLTGVMYFSKNISQPKQEVAQSASVPTITVVPTQTDKILNPAQAAKNPELAFTEKDKKRLETGIVSQDHAVVLSVLSSALQELLATQSASLVPPGTTIQLDEKDLAVGQYAEGGPMFGAIGGISTEPGLQPKKILVGLIKEKGEWLVTFVGPHP